MRPTLPRIVGMVHHVVEGDEQGNDVVVGDRITNPFLGGEAAALYRTGRLDHASRAMAVVLAIVGAKRVPRALDIGCGTGLSTTALTTASEFTVGLDPAPAMVDIAAADTGARYVVAEGEVVPFRDKAFDAITLSSAFHWLERDRLFEECRRLLASGGWLAIYDHFLVGVEDGPEYVAWVNDVYLSRYPVPFRSEGFGPQSPLPTGYRRVGQKKYDDPRTMTRAELVEYHLSQSIALMGMKHRGETVADARSWLDRELTQFIPADSTATVQFVGTVSCLAVDPRS